MVFLAGLLLFTLAEYLVHRYAYHPPEFEEERKHFLHFAHGFHHDHPRDPQHLAMPPLFSLLLSSLVLGISYLLIGPWAFAFTAGFILGYAIYLLIHYILHVYSPPENRFKYLWQHHAIHHFHDDTVAYGVSSPLWDIIFGTMPKRKKKAT